MARRDPHSFADDTQPKATHYSIELFVDFEKKQLRGECKIQLTRDASGLLDLDTRGITVLSAEDAQGRALDFNLAEMHSFLGQKLSIKTTTSTIRLKFETGESAKALQWLSPQQTNGGRCPFLFTQCQPIHARSLFPCQDSPRVRATYNLAVNVPADLTAVAAAAHESISTERDRRVFSFKMPQPIPSYLFAFAVGKIESRELGARTRVYGEPGILDEAAREFEDVGDMLAAAEQLFGPYLWERFDLLVMPSSFPYGGMENPRLTFLTPSLLAKDKSLVNVLAHELAHSWTGNLVTNASMNHFWLNEGFTVYAERRILEELEGEEGAALQAAIGRKALQETIDKLSQVDPALTCLETDLRDTDPDEVYSLVPYEKGFLFLTKLEEAVGRPRFDIFLKAYIEAFRFQSIETEDFERFLEQNLPEAGSVDKGAWLHEPGLPEHAPVFRSEKLAHIQRLASEWNQGRRPHPAVLKALSPTQWQLFLGEIEEAQSIENCAWLDQIFRLSKVSNSEILVAWLTIATRSSYAPAIPAVENMLKSNGRMKYLAPLYGALRSQGETGLKIALRIFEQAKHGYHPVTRAMVEKVLGATDAAHSKVPVHEFDELAQLIRPHYSRFLAGKAEVAILTGHSHQCWPNASRDGHLQAWDDAAEKIGGKWSHVFDEVVPNFRRHVAKRIGTERSEDIAIAPNTHELVARLLSCFAPNAKVLTTNEEFHSLDRQLSRLEEDGLMVERISINNDFAERMLSATKVAAPDLVAFSSVSFLTGAQLENLDHLLQQLATLDVTVLVDGYHAFNVTEITADEWAGDDVFLTAGGYKYAEGGEGACWMLLPKNSQQYRPKNTGWFADFDALEGRQEVVNYGNGGARFFGSTFDPTAFYRSNAVFDWMDDQRLSPKVLRSQSLLQTSFILEMYDRLKLDQQGFSVRTPREPKRRAGFVAIEHPKAATIHAQLLERGVWIDRRGNILRLGPAPFTSSGEISRAVEALLQTAS